MRLSLEESTYRVEMVVYYKVFKQREVSQKREREKESLLPLAAEEVSGNKIVQVSQVLLTPIKSPIPKLRNSLFSIPLFGKTHKQKNNK